MELVVQFADVRIPAVLVASEPDENLRNLGKHIRPFCQDLVQASHGRINNKSYGGRHTLLLVDGSPRIVVIEGGRFDEHLRVLGQVRDFDHVASVHQLSVRLLDLILDLVTLGTLCMVHAEGLDVVVMSSVLLCQELHWILDEWKVHPHSLLLQVNVDGLLDDFLLEVLLEALCLGSRR